MIPTFRDAPLALGFLEWRFETGKDALVLVVKGAYRLQHDGRAEPLELPSLEGDVYTGNDPRSGACRYASDLVPLKPKADLLCVGRVHTPEGRPLPQCSAAFGVGGTSLSVLVSGDRYWIDGNTASEPVPFTAMDLGWERAFGGPEWAANPAGRGAGTARAAIDRPLPNVEEPGELVRTAAQRPAPAGFGPLGPFWSHRLSKWPRIESDWTAERWPWPPQDLDYTYFNAAQPALQVEGYLKGDETIACENLHPKHRRYRCELPRVRPRCFVSETAELREAALRLDTLWVDMEQERLVLVWRGSVPVAGAIDCAYVAAEGFDDPRLPLEHYRQRLALHRLDREPAPVADVVRGDGAEAANDDDAPAPKTPAATRPPRPLVPPALRAELARIGAPADVLAALDSGDLAAIEAAARAHFEVDAAAFEKLVQEANERMRKMLVDAGKDPSVLDARPKQPRRREPPRSEPRAWTRERVEAALSAGAESPVLLAGADLSGLDLGGLDFRARNLSGCVLTGAKLDKARFDGTDLTGATLAGTSAEGAGFAGAVLEDADLTGIAAPGCDFAGAAMKNALLDDARIAGAKLTACNAAGASFVRADLAGADLGKAILRDARFTEARIDRVVLRGADLTGARAESATGEGVDFRDAVLVRFDASGQSRLPGAKLPGCKAERSRWMDADLTGADMTKADLRGADFYGAKLGGARLGGADCRDADFTNAVLAKATLALANLWAARLEGADLRKADLRGASLYQAALWQARVEGVAIDGAFTAGTLFETPVRRWAR